MSELSAVDKWLYTMLSTDAALTAIVSTRVYDTLAVESATFPYVVFRYQGGSDVRTNGAGRIMVSSVYQVKVIGKGVPFSSLTAAASRIDALLNAKYGANSDGQVWAVREQPIKYLELDNGVQYRHLGGLYRVWSQEA